MKNLFFVIFDSCRFDTYKRAKTPYINNIGAAECRYSYASWTSPSHYVYLMGLMPHISPKHVFASNVYKEEFAKWKERLGVDDLSFRSFLPHINLPTKLKQLGYKTIGRVSMPVLNQYTTMSTGFDDYKLMDNHFDFKGMVDDVSFEGNQPKFYFFNVGETHYPYMLDDLPHISGVHGVFKKMDADPVGVSDDAFFEMEQMKRLHNQQVKCVEYLDEIIGELFKKCPANTYFIITADHGELFGEDGYFGHGPVFHEKVFEVPFIEGQLPKI
ncbi:MAG: sulfatase-like hydrolase/transferase [Chitinivibrionales bacterium]|nr:sulfatase-like hydrolase/transferase [Chitinivibrionales bacterium]